MIVVGKKQNEGRAANINLQEQQLSKEGQVLSYNQPLYASQISMYSPSSNE